MQVVFDGTRAGRVLFQGALANFNPHPATRVDFGNPDRAPLPIIAGHLWGQETPDVILEGAPTKGG